MRIVKLIIPASLGMMVGMMTEMINLIVVGHLKNAAMVAGVGMGNATLNLTGQSIILGFNSALDTLISNAAGSKNLELCGVYLNRGRFLMTILFIPISAILFNTKSILVAIGQDEEVAGFS